MCAPFAIVSVFFGLYEELLISIYPEIVHKSYNRMLPSKNILITFFICKIEVHCVNEMSQSSTMTLDDEAIMQPPVELHVSDAIVQVLLLT